MIKVLGAAKHLIEKGVRANIVAPGPVWTVRQPKGSAFGRRGQPVELAPVYVLLARQERGYISGEVYGVTGGAGVT